MEAAEDYEACDRCEAHVPNGHGEYVEGDRICSECYESVADSIAE